MVKSCYRFVFLAVLSCLCLGISLEFEASAARTIIPAGSDWKYLDDGSNQGVAWRHVAFNDSTWASGPAQLGYGDGDEATEISFGPSSSSKYTTYYYRHTFVIQDASLLEDPLSIELVRDDGGVVYLNGREVFRSNMPSGTITSTTFAASTTPNGQENDFREQVIPPGDLVMGTNVVAVEVHQANLTSSDTSFDLRLTTTTGDPGANLTRGPYLQMVTPTSALVRWRTDASRSSVVRFGRNLGYRDGTNTMSGTRTEHEVTLSGLQPNTRYFYSLATQLGVLLEGPEYHFFTPPLPGTHQPIRFWVIGDSGTGNGDARDVRDAFLGFSGNARVDGVLLLGDNAYDDGTDSEMQDAIYDIYPTLLRRTPFWPAIGNHDTAESSSPPANLPHFLNWTLPRNGEVGGFASGTERYFSFDHGNVHVIVLDSMSSSLSSSGPMMNWLRTDLARNTQDWIIVCLHHPPYSDGSTKSDSTSNSISLRNSAIRILEDGGADLVLAGDSHSYERSFLIDGHYGTSSTFQESMKVNGGDGREDGDGPYYKLGGASAHQGTVYAVVGSSGRLDNGNFNHPAMYYGVRELGSMVLDIDGGRLDARWIDDNGNVDDYFTILKTFPEFVTITVHPLNHAVEPGEEVTLTVQAISQNEKTYQWRKDGQVIAGATNTALILPNVQESDTGSYDVIVTDAVSSATSNPARVDLRVRPAVISIPGDFSVVEGGTLILSVETVGTLPMGYRWRRGPFTITNRTSIEHQDFFIIENVQTTDAGRWTVVMTNSVFFQPGVLSPSVNVAVVPDGDGDGLPDDYETARGMNPADPADALLDGDGDGLTVIDEFTAGTDPDDSMSDLRLDQIAMEEGGMRIEFQAVSNRTYTVQYKEMVDDANWIKLADIVASSTNRVRTVIDSAGDPTRYYRLVTPRQGP